MLTHESTPIYFQKKSTLHYKGELIDLSEPRVMGILNVTPDSFYDGGRFLSVPEAVGQVARMLEEGASMIDIGACSTRPGAPEVDETVELSRLLPVFKVVTREFPDAILSIDTYRSAVAETIIGEFGECIVNDISGGMFDRCMFETVARLKVPYVLMHIQGTPKTMQLAPAYTHVTKEVIRQLSEGVYRLHELGVRDVIIDPGFGFGKNLEHNYELLNNLDAFRIFELPILVGLSRKSMIYKLLGQSPEESLNGTTVLNTLALQAGVNILRVHDVKPAVEAVTLFQQLKKNEQ